MMNRHEVLESAMCKELDKLEDKYKGGVEMSLDDLKKLDLLYHTLKSKATYDAMTEANEYGYEGGMSGRRGRDSMGRYVSRDMGPGYSGHYPPYDPYMPPEWRR